MKSKKSRYILSSLLLVFALFLLLFYTQRYRYTRSFDLSIKPVEKGQKVYVCGHSFHQFIAAPLDTLAKEAGFADSENLGVDFIGNFSPTRHWNVPDSINKTKKALMAGEVDVLTLAPNIIVPDSGIDKFTELALNYNPNIRVLIQISWAPSDGERNQAIFKNEYRDTITLYSLNKFRKMASVYVEKIRAQVNAINERYNHKFVFIVPAGAAVLNVREEVLAGIVPLITEQSQLFKDNGGHGTESLRQLVTYCWFAAVYHRSPVGLNSFIKPGIKGSKELQRELQKIAWQTVNKEPLNGLEDDLPDTKE